ncbi:MAG: YncE family protein [Gemmatimonadales bacterium]
MRSVTRSVVRSAAVLGLAIASSATALAAQATARWYFGTYSNELIVWDEASEQIVNRIQMRNRIPGDITVSESKDRLYAKEATSQTIEIVDIARAQVIDDFTLSRDSVTVRIDGFAVHPSNARAVLSIMRYTKHRDRYSVDGPFLVEYDLRAKAVTDTIPLPDDIDADVNFRYAPDGETLYLFGDEIVAVDAETYEELSRWDLSSPIEPGLGATNFSTNSSIYDEPGVATSIFRMTDPAQNRRMMGIARVRLAERDVEFFTLGTAEPVNQFQLAPGGERAYGLFSQVGRYEFWEFDIPGRRVLRRQPFAGRPRMGLRVGADGSKLYVYVAGPTIDVYDARTFELLHTVTFDQDMAMGVAVVPGAPGR